MRKPLTMTDKFGGIWMRIDAPIDACQQAPSPQDGHQFEMAQTNLHPDAWTMLGGQFRPEPKDPTIADLRREIAELRILIIKEKS